MTNEEERRYLFEERRSLLIAVVLGALIAVLVVAVGKWFASEKCDRQWAQSGLKSDWGWTQGCIVQRKDGTWVPATAIRDMTQ